MRGVDKYLTQQEKDLKADWRGAGATLAHLKGDDVQISGVRLGMEPPKVVVAAPAVALAALGLFAAQPQPAAVAAGPQAAKTKAEIAREAAEARMAAKQAIVAAKKREEILAAAAAAPEAGAENDEDDDERARMRQA